MKKRDRRITPTSTSLAAGWTDAVPESTGPSEKMIDTSLKEAGISDVIIKNKSGGVI